MVEVKTVEEETISLRWFVLRVKAVVINSEDRQKKALLVSIAMPDDKLKGDEWKNANLWLQPYELDWLSMKFHDAAKKIMRAYDNIKVLKKTSNNSSDISSDT